MLSSQILCYIPRTVAYVLEVPYMNLHEKHKPTAYLLRYKLVFFQENTEKFNISFGYPHKDACI